MNRREFSHHVFVLGLGLSGTGIVNNAEAQNSTVPVEGKDYVRLREPLPASGSGKVEVVEFFWYNCSHCFAFEPLVEAWQKKLPSRVDFKRVPVAFRDSFVPQQKTFYALEAMGLLPSMHKKIFFAIHQGKKQHLDKFEDISQFLADNGVNKAKFTELFNSFSVVSKANKAKQLADSYKIDGVPTIGIQGKYFTSGSLAGSAEAALSVADYLIQRELK